MNEPETSEEKAATQATRERCLCQEVVDRLEFLLGVSPTVREHLLNSRVEFLKAVRSALDERIDRLSSVSRRGSKISVE
jgi:hypothetical protein